MGGRGQLQRSATLSQSKTTAAKEKDGGAKAKFKRPFPYPLPQFSNFSMDFPVHENGVLSYQRRYQMTQQQRISRFRQQRNFRSLRDPTFNYSGGTSTYEPCSREIEDDEQQYLMRPTTPTPPLGMGSGQRRWSPDVDGRSPSLSWRDSSGLQRQVAQQQVRQPLLRSGGGSSSRSREDDAMVENCVSAPLVENARHHPPGMRLNDEPNS